MKTVSVWEGSMDILEKRMLFHDEIGPGLLMSHACHLANLRQVTDPFYLPGGVPEDVRLSAVLVAPSGFSKSYSMKMFTDDVLGIMPYPSKFCGKLTEAGFVGTIKEGEEIRGDAWRYREGILSFHEITNIFVAEQSDHSPELVNQVMEVLTEGRLNKTLAGGSISYPSGVTIQGGVQPKRFDFSAGLARRFLFIAKKWDAEARERLKLRMRPGGAEDVGIYKETQDAVKDIRSRVRNLQENFKPTCVELTDELWQHLLDNTTTHIEMSLKMRALIGYQTFQLDESGIHGPLKIKLDDGTKYVLGLVSDMDRLVSEGADTALVVNELEAFPKREATRAELFRIFQGYSYGYGGFIHLMDEMKRQGIVKSKRVRGEYGYQLVYNRDGSKDKEEDEGDRVYV